VSTQVDEVKRVREELDKLMAGDDVRKKNIHLADILRPMAGSHLRPEIYVDREFYLSMKAQLETDEKYKAFQQTLSDAIPVAVERMRFDTKKISFEKAFQQALRDLPGEDKWKLAEAFLQKLPREGVTFETAAEAAKLKAEELETKAKALPEAEKKLDMAKSAA